MALAIMSVGAVGIMALQQASTRGNMQARQMSAATAVTRTWLERARRDALGWNVNQVAGIAMTQYLVNTPPAGASGWFAPTPAAGAESWGFDWFGRDTRDASAMQFCTHLQTRWVVVGQVIRVDARTFWYRRGDGTAGSSNQTLFPNCAAGGTEGAVTAELALTAPRVHSIQASTLVRWIP